MWCYVSFLKVSDYVLRNLRSEEGAVLSPNISCFMSAAGTMHPDRATWWREGPVSSQFQVTVRHDREGQGRDWKQLLVTVKSREE